MSCESTTVREKTRIGESEAEERSINGLASVWLRGNNPFVPALGTVHLDLRLAIRGLSFANRAGYILKPSIFEPG
jgi:hypothetical protein